MAAARFNGTNREMCGALIHWDKNRAFEGDVKGSRFVCHDKDERIIDKDMLYAIGVPFETDNFVWAYFTERHRYLCPGRVTAKGDEKSFVVFDDGGQANLLNEWIHKRVLAESRWLPEDQLPWILPSLRWKYGARAKSVAIGEVGPEDRYGGSALIHWDTIRAFEGKVRMPSTDSSKLKFICHDKDERIIDKKEVYHIGQRFNLNDEVWAYHTDKHQYLSSGKVTAKGPLSSIVVFHGGDEAHLPNEWIHMKVLVPVSFFDLRVGNVEVEWSVMGRGLRGWPMAPPAL